MSAEDLKLEGNKLFQQHNYQQSITKYNQAIQLDPKNAVYYANRSAAYTSLHQFNKAASDAKKSIKLDPMYYKAYSRLAFAYQMLHQYQDAIKQYKAALNHSPTDRSYKYIIEQITKCLSKCDNYKDNDDKYNDDHKHNIHDNAQKKKIKDFDDYTLEHAHCLFGHLISKNIENFTRSQMVKAFADFVPIYNVLFPSKKMSKEDFAIYCETKYGMDLIEQYDHKFMLTSIDNSSHGHVLVGKPKTNQNNNNNKRKIKIKSMNNQNNIIHSTGKRKLFPNFKLSKKMKQIIHNKSVNDIFDVAIVFEYDLKQYEVASAIYKYLCNIHHTKGIGSFALWYLEGSRRGISKDLKMAYTLFEYALFLEPKYGLALYNMARFYFNGDIVDKDYNKAFILCKKSIKDKRMSNELRHFQSYFLLSTMYADGRGIFKNYALANKYLKIANQLQFGLDDSKNATFDKTSKIYDKLHKMHENHSQRELDTRWDTMRAYSDKYIEQKLDELEQKIGFRPERYICTVGEYVNILKMCGFEVFGYNEIVMKDIKCENGWMAQYFQTLGITYGVDKSFDWNESQIKRVRLCGGCKEVINGKVYLCRNCEKSYCSKKCQKKEWPSHKQQCNLVRNVIESSYPPPTHFELI